MIDLILIIQIFNFAEELKFPFHVQPLLHNKNLHLPLHNKIPFPKKHLVHLYYLGYRQINFNKKFKIYFFYQ